MTPLGVHIDAPSGGIDSARNLRDKATTFRISAPQVRLKREEKTMKTSGKTFWVLLVAFSLVFATNGLAPAVVVGDKAPDFELDSTKGGKLKLSSLKGKNVLINFYVLDFSPT
jgi:AhpC/TSA family